MDSFVFMITTVTCAIVAYFTYHQEDSKKQITELQQYVRNIELSQKDKNDHIMKCILYKAVCISEPVHGIRIDQDGFTFKDLIAVDDKGDEVLFEINRNEKKNWGYRFERHSLYLEDHSPIIIKFSGPIFFKYIEFKNLDHCNSDNAEIVLLLKQEEIKVSITKQKNIVCNTFLKN